jgi:hypothetical protein
MEFRQTGCIPPPQQHFQFPQSFFSRHNHKPVLLCKVRYIGHLLNIVGKNKRFVFVTKDPEINTNITIFVLAHNSLPISDPSTPKQGHLQSYIIKLPYLLYLTIICVCLCVIIIIMTIVNDGPYEGPIRRTREWGSEWELIRNLLKGDRGSNKKKTASNSRLQLTTQVGQAHAATGVLLDLGTNSQPHRPDNAAEHKTWASLTYTSQAYEDHRSDRSLLVKPDDFHRTTLHRSGRCNTPVRPVWARKPQNTKQTYRAPKRPKLETAATRDSSELTQTFTRAKPNRGLHRSDRWEAPVRPVWPELVGMNSTRGSTPSNPTPDLPHRSTE